MQNLVIVTNLGCVRTFRYQPPGDDPREKAHLVEDGSETFEEAGMPLSDLTEDQQGRFGRPGSPAMVSGEEHNLKGELERRALRRVAKQVSAKVREAGSPRWVLTAPQPVLKRLVNSISPQCRAKLDTTVPADLTGLPVAKVEERFLSS